MMSEGQVIDTSQIELRKGHLDVVKQRVEEQERNVLKAEEKKEEERQHLVKRVQDKRIMEIDRQKKNVSWRKVMDKEANKFMDEIAAIQFSRTLRETEEKDTM